MEAQKQTLTAILKHLDDTKNDASVDGELIAQARKLITRAYGVDAEEKNEDDVAFDKFVQRLKQTPFFAGVEEGSEEYERRLAKARAKFDARRAPETPTDDKEPAVPSVDAETRAKADALKLEGNAQLKAGDYAAAAETYTKCIELDGSNAIYYGNRAAAKMHLKELAAAVDDCKMAVNIDPSYARAHERLASAYKSLGMDDAELEALENATRIHPDHAQLAKMLADAKKRRAPAEMPDLSALGGGNGQMPDPEQLASMASAMGLPNVSPEMVRAFMDSPMGAQMASAMQGNNPAMAQMMQQGMEAMKNNPGLMAEAMKAMMGGGGAGGNSGDTGSN